LEQESDNPTPWFFFEPVRKPAVDPLESHAAVSTSAAAADLAAKHQPPEEVSIQQEHPSPGWLDDTSIQIIHATRSWIQYGTVGFAVICIVIGAVEGLFGR
jgi:hypothetical protein